MVFVARGELLSSATPVTRSSDEMESGQVAASCQNTQSHCGQGDRRATTRGPEIVQGPVAIQPDPLLPAHDLALPILAHSSRHSVQFASTVGVKPIGMLGQALAVLAITNVVSGCSLTAPRKGQERSYQTGTTIRENKNSMPSSRYR